MIQARKSPNSIVVQFADDGTIIHVYAKLARQLWENQTLVASSETTQMVALPETTMVELQAVMAQQTQPDA